jgi:hypothetical protein
MQDIKQNIDFPMNLLFRCNDIGMNLKSTPAPVKLQNRKQNGCMCVNVYAGLCSGIEVSVVQAVQLHLATVMRIRNMKECIWTVVAAEFGER